MSRVSLRLRKGDEVKYLSHRDLMRAFEFAMRRARIPVRYSAGFNPRPRMSFGSAVGVGVTSDDERVVVELVSTEDPSEIRERLNSQLPNGLNVLEAEAVPDDVKSPVSGLNASQFRIMAACGAGDSAQDIGTAVRKLLESAEARVIRMRKGQAREVDVRPHILQADAKECGNCSVVIDVSLGFGDSGGAGPQDFVQALRSWAPNLCVKSIHRSRQFHAP